MRSRPRPRSPACGLCRGRGRAAKGLGPKGAAGQSSGCGSFGPRPGPRGAPPPAGRTPESVGASSRLELGRSGPRALAPSPPRRGRHLRDVDQLLIKKAAPGVFNHLPLRGLRASSRGPRDFGEPGARRGRPGAGRTHGAGRGAARGAGPGHSPSSDEKEAEGSMALWKPSSIFRPSSMSGPRAPAGGATPDARAGAGPRAEAGGRRGRAPGPRERLRRV